MLGAQPSNMVAGRTVACTGEGAVDIAGVVGTGAVPVGRRAGVVAVEAAVPARAFAWGPAPSAECSGECCGESP